MKVREKVGKSRNTVFFHWCVAPEGRKVGSLKRRVRSHLARWEIKKLHAVVARSTFPSQFFSKHHMFGPLLEVAMWKSVRRCGAKHISKSKCTKHHMFGPLLEVAMLKKCTVLWREAHFEFKMLKARGGWTTFGGSDVVSRGRCKGLCTLSKSEQNLRICSIFNYNHHYTYTPIHYTTTTATPPLHSTTLHYTPLYYTQLHSITLNYTTLHYATLHYTSLHYIPLHYTTFHYTTLHYITLHHTTLHSTTLHYITLHSTTLK